MRLIDADKIKPEDFYDRVDYLECMEVINEQPTAYDVEAVVRELEDGFDFCKSVWEGAYCDSEDMDCSYCAIQKTIEIVKRGGRNECNDLLR